MSEKTVAVQTIFNHPQVTATLKERPLFLNPKVMEAATFGILNSTLNQEYMTAFLPGWGGGGEGGGGREGIPYEKERVLVVPFKPVKAVLVSLI